MVLHITPEDYPVQAIEMAERKGKGHPDTLCDDISDAVSTALCRYYYRHFGAILHHNVDKALLIGGQSEPAFGGGEVLKPIELILAGRATQQVGNQTVPVTDIALETARNWLAQTLPHLDVDRHIRISAHIRPGSSELVALFQRFGRGEIVPLANDTSMGAGFFPLTPLERDILRIDEWLSSPAAKQQFPFIGEDTKVMGVRQQGRSVFTVAIAMVDRYIRSISDYADKIQAVKNAARTALGLDDSVLLDINTADDYAQNSLYLTVTGTSAESGDDGQVGRGNRANGLITPYRPMTLEALAGKNPVSHVGKIYNIFARELSRAIVEAGQAEEASVFMVSQIGKPVHEPQLLHIRLKGQQAGAEQVEALARERLRELPRFWAGVIGNASPGLR